MTRLPGTSGIRWKRVAWFYAFSVAGISLAALGLYLLGGAAGGLAATGVSAAAMFSPLVATVVVNRLDGESAFAGLARFRFSRWLGVASLMPVVLAYGAMLVGLLLPGVSLDWEMAAMFERFGGMLSADEVARAKAQIDGLPVHPVWLGVPQAIVAGLTINAVFGFAEEVGWRGWLHQELAPLGFWKANAVTGVLWGLWHAPLILQGHNYPVHRVEGVFLFTLVCLLLSPLLSHVRSRADTVWAAAVFHGTFNAAAGVSMLVVVGSDLVVGVQGAAGLIVLGIANLLLLTFRRSVPPVAGASST